MSNLAGKPPLGLKLERPKPSPEHLARVKALPCVICGAPPPSDAHHCIHDRFGTLKASDYETIPLCKAHHQWGAEAIHAGKATWREKWGPDHGYLPAVAKMLAQEEALDRLAQLGQDVEEKDKGTYRTRLSRAAQLRWLSASRG